MSIYFKQLSLLAVAMVLALPNSLLASSGIIASKGDSFLSKAVGLEPFPIGKTHQYPAGQYKFRVVGTGKPGLVTVIIVDSSGKQLGRVPGRFSGSGPGKPTKTTFAQLGYSESSEVKVAQETGGACTVCKVVTIECGNGSVIEFHLNNSNGGYWRGYW